MSSREVIKSDDNPEIQPIQRQLIYFLMTTYQSRHWFLGRHQKLLSPVSLRGRTHLHIRCVGWAQEGLPAESQNGTQTKRCKLCHRSSQSRLIFFNNDHCHFILVDPHFTIPQYSFFIAMVLGCYCISTIMINNNFESALVYHTTLLQPRNLHCRTTTERIFWT